MSKREPTPQEQEIIRAKLAWSMWDMLRRMGIFILLFSGLTRCSQQEIDQGMRKSALSETLMKAADVGNWKNGTVLNLEDVQKASVPVYEQKKAEAEKSFYTYLMLAGGLSLAGHLGASRSKRKLSELGAFKNDDNDGPSLSP